MPSAKRVASSRCPLYFLKSFNGGVRMPAVITSVNLILMSAWSFCRLLRRAPFDFSAGAAGSDEGVTTATVGESMRMSNRRNESTISFGVSLDVFRRSNRISALSADASIPRSASFTRLST